MELSHSTWGSALVAKAEEQEVSDNGEKCRALGNFVVQGHMKTAWLLLCMYVPHISKQDSQKLKLPMVGVEIVDLPDLLQSLETLRYQIQMS